MHEKGEEIATDTRHNTDFNRVQNRTRHKIKELNVTRENVNLIRANDRGHIPTRIRHWRLDASRSHTPDYQREPQRTVHLTHPRVHSSTYIPSKHERRLCTRDIAMSESLPVQIANHPRCSRMFVDPRQGLPDHHLISPIRPDGC